MPNMQRGESETNRVGLFLPIPSKISERSTPMSPCTAPMKTSLTRKVTASTFVLVLRNADFGGADLVICGNVPQGAGLSSSASLEVAVGQALQSLYQLPLSGVELALNGQEAENQFVG